MPNNPEEREFAIGYLRQLRHIQVFQNIFVPRRVLSSLNSAIKTQDEYIRTLPARTREETNTAKCVREYLDSLLWEMKKTDVQEAQLDSFLRAFEIWLKARSLRAVVITPCFGLTGSFSKLVHLLTSDKRDFIENLADDIELWLFSHCADITAEWPYFLQFTPQVAKTLESDPSLLEYRRRLANLRNQYLSWNIENRRLTRYERLLSTMISSLNEINIHLSTKYHENMIIRKGPLGPSKQNLIARTCPQWKCRKFGKILEDFETEGIFSPYFINLDLYPSELIESVDLSKHQKKDKLPFWIALCSETLPKASLELALGEYKKRIGA
jgi:hypothetical protein